MLILNGWALGCDVRLQRTLTQRICFFLGHRLQHERGQRFFGGEACCQLTGRRGAIRPPLEFVQCGEHLVGARSANRQIPRIGGRNGVKNLDRSWSSHGLKKSLHLVNVFDVGGTDGTRNLPTWQHPSQEACPPTPLLWHPPDTICRWPMNDLCRPISEHRCRTG